MKYAVYRKKSVGIYTVTFIVHVLVSLYAVYTPGLSLPSVAARNGYVHVGDILKKDPLGDLIWQLSGEWEYLPEADSPDALFSAAACNLKTVAVERIESRKSGAYRLVLDGLAGTDPVVLHVPPVLLEKNILINRQPVVYQDYCAAHGEPATGCFDAVQCCLFPGLLRLEAVPDRIEIVIYIQPFSPVDTVFPVPAIAFSDVIFTHYFRFHMIRLLFAVLLLFLLFSCTVIFYSAGFFRTGLRITVCNLSFLLYFSANAKYTDNFFFHAEWSSNLLFRVRYISLFIFLYILIKLGQHISGRMSFGVQNIINSLFCTLLFIFSAFPLSVIHYGMDIYNMIPAVSCTWLAVKTVIRTFIKKEIAPYYCLATLLIYASFFGEPELLPVPPALIGYLHRGIPKEHDFSLQRCVCAISSFVNMYLSLIFFYSFQYFYCAGSAFRPLFLTDKTAVIESYGFSDRERQVLDLLLAGKDNRTIADNLCISVPTVKSHVSRIFKITGVHSRRELLELFI